MFYWERESDTHIFFWDGIFCQWYKAPMKDPKTNATYRCCEQYMMAQKSLLFGDEIAHQMIMDSDNPRRIKHLGRLVSNYDQEIWDQNKYQIVLDGNLMKFTQNEFLHTLLVKGTQNKIIVEASPEDTIWGIGLSHEDDDVLDESKWKGENLLGKALMETRSHLKNKSPLKRDYNSPYSIYNLGDSERKSA